MSSQTCQERRTAARIKLPPMLTSVIARPAGDPEAAEHHGHAYDISATGVRIELDQPLTPGDKVNVHVELPWDGHHIDALADVVWVNDDEDDPGPRRMALQFVSFGESTDRRRFDAMFDGSAVRMAA